MKLQKAEADSDLNTTAQSDQEADDCRKSKRRKKYFFVLYTRICM